jgi:Metallo-beta-lactamase superfamily
MNHCDPIRRVSVVSTDPRYFPTGALLGPLFSMAKFEMAGEQTLSVLLQGLGYRANDVAMVVLSHLHGDHIGGLREVSQADLLLSRPEWDTLSGSWPELAGVMRRHIELPGLRWHQIDPAPLHDPTLVLTCMVVATVAEQAMVGWLLTFGIKASAANGQARLQRPSLSPK